ncbi:MAG: glycoside hydrolase family 43 protein [Firmicutes bacterium]|nr:glycoside hydrolase family 43 protein [Bacillota bacterium]
MKRKIILVCILGAVLTFSLPACSDAGTQGQSGGTGENGDVDDADNAGAGQTGEGGAGNTKENGEGSGEAMGETGADSDYIVSFDGIATAEIRAGVSVHDPSVIRADGKYYIFGSHMSTAVSEDLRSWTSVGDGYKNSNPIYYGLMENKTAFAYTGSKNSVIPTDDGGWHVWAPDIIYNESAGLYYLYFCMSSTWNASNLCYATSESIEGPYEWKGAMIYSGFTEGSLGATDVTEYVDRDEAKARYIKANGEYNFDRYPNAIDPTVLYDEDGRLWMVYGSWSGGMYLLELDKDTGEVIHPEADEANRVDAYFGKRLMGGLHTSIEGPYILYDAESGYYYLFVSYGGLARTGGYQIRVFRSETIDGDYVDMNGKYPLDTGNLKQSPYGLKLSGNYYLPSLSMAYMATGHNSAFIDEDGRKYIVNHTRFDNNSEFHEPRVHQFIVNEEGWPCMLPYATDGETVSETGYENGELTGKYYVINQGTSIDAQIAQPFILYLEEDGTVRGDGVRGNWEAKEGSCYMKLTYGEKSYSGVFCQMNDEAGTQVMTFSAVGSNESVWGVKYR